MTETQPKKTEKNPMGWSFRVRDTSHRIAGYCFDYDEAYEVCIEFARNATRGGYSQIDYFADGRWNRGEGYCRQDLIDCHMIDEHGCWA